jgi:phosphoribosyl 1,2-cyclic phosphodiesterase
MLVRCWGSRGSIAVSGREYIKYGGDTTCLEIVAGNGEMVIVDAGTGIRKLGNRLISEGRCDVNIVLTHPHWDHFSGFPFFKPLYKKGCKINVWGPHPTQESVKGIISKAMSTPHFPVELEDIQAEINFFGIGKRSFRIGSISISSIALNHPNQGAGYRFEENGKSFVFLTDNELAHAHRTDFTYEDYVKFAEGADLLFHDAEYTQEDYEHTEGWGHSVYLDTLKFAIDAGVKTLGLFHHNQDRDDDGVDAIEADCRRILKEKGLSMECFAVAGGSEVKL